MTLVMLVAGVGGWCAHQYWARLDQHERWRREFWSWALRGAVFPAVIWAVVNVGFGDRFPPLVPALADAQVHRQPWLSLWVAASLYGWILVLSWWAAITYVWILILMAGQAPDGREFAFNLAVIGILSGACGVAMANVAGVNGYAAAIVVALLPIVHFTIDLAEKPPPRVTYDRAIAQMKFGKYDAAEWEVISQLEKREDDFEGWMMLAELYATQFRNLEDAARVILDICQQPNSQGVHISVACHKLADWQLEIAGNSAGARAALELLCRKLPGTHFARMAQQRIRQLPRSDEELAELKKPRRIRLPVLREDAPAEPEPSKASSRADAAAEANRLTEKLTEDPNDVATREKLALVLAEKLGKTALAMDQLRLLLELEEPGDEQKAKWLALIATWEFKTSNNHEKLRAALQELISSYPQSTHAFAAQRKLFLMEMEAPVASS